MDGQEPTAHRSSRLTFSMKPILSFFLPNSARHIGRMPPWLVVLDFIHRIEAAGENDDIHRTVGACDVAFHIHPRFKPNSRLDDIDDFRCRSV
jgi:hypothetical protein